jgi:hypothetical protein
MVTLCNYLLIREGAGEINKGDGMKKAGILVLMQTVAIILLFPPFKSDAKTFSSAAPISGNFYFEMHQDSLMDKNFVDVFGPIPLNNVPVNAVNIPLAGNFTTGTPAALPPVPLLVKYVYKVTLDTAQTLNLTVANNSSADFSIVQVTLGTLGSTTITNLTHNTSGVAQFNAGGKEIDSAVTVSVTLTPAGSGTFAAGNNLGTSFSLNGLKAVKVVACDSLLKDYKRTFTNEYDLTDSLDVDYIDIDKGFFIYSVTNNTGLDLLLSVTHRHLWRSDFCRGKNPPLTRINDLAGLSFQDSLIASNCIIAIREQFPANQTNLYSKHNISANRLFAEWNTVKKKSVSKVDCMLNIGVYGRRVTLSAEDSLQFAIKTASFKYKEMYGIVMDTFRRSSDTVKSAVPMSWYSDSNPKYVSMAVYMPDSEFVETLSGVLNFFSPIAPDSNCTVTLQFTHAVNNSHVASQLDISRITNQKPDSICFAGSIIIPAGSRVKLINDLTDPNDPDYSKYMGRMKIRDIVTVETATLPGGVSAGRTPPSRFECYGSSKTLRYTLPAQCRVSIKYYDIKGRLIYSFVNKYQGPGRYSQSIPVYAIAHGAYLRIFEAGTFVKKETVLILR